MIIRVHKELTMVQSMLLRGSLLAHHVILADTALHLDNKLQLVLVKQVSIAHLGLLSKNLQGILTI